MDKFGQVSNKNWYHTLSTPVHDIGLRRLEFVISSVTKFEKNRIIKNLIYCRITIKKHTINRISSSQIDIYKYNIQFKCNFCISRRINVEMKKKSIFRYTVQRLKIHFLLTVNGGNLIKRDFKV